MGTDREDRGQSDKPANPEAVRPGTPGAGENICRRCGGAGKIAGDACPECGGAGKIAEPLAGG
jgi:RecJ-like exonuclease